MVARTPSVILTDVERIIPIVVGASLAAEQGDRPPAQALAVMIEQHLDAIDHAGAPADPGERTPAVRPVVCTDLWFLNHDDLRARPTIAVGAPEHNALSAFLIGRLPRVFSIDGRMAIHLDLRHRELVACCWGVNAASTAQACAIFAQRHLPAWLRAAV